MMILAVCCLLAAIAGTDEDVRARPVAVLYAKGGVTQADGAMPVVRLA